MHILITRRFLLFAALLLAAVTAWAELPNRNPENVHYAGQRIGRDKKTTEAYAGPTVDYDTTDQTSILANTREHNLRQARSSRYTSRAPQPLAELASVEFDINTHWEIGLQPLPVVQSDTVVLGKIVEAKAYVSNDKMGVYSEFSVQIEKILKNSGPPIKDSLIAEREGGVVRFASGRLLPFRINHQRLPRVHRNYILFLKHNEQSGDYHIITGYELRHKRVSPLDEVEKFAVFEGLDEQEFLTTVQEAITDTSQKKEKTN